MPRARVQPRPAGLKLSRDRLSPGRHDGTGRPPRPPQLVLSVSSTYSAILHAPTYRSQPVACRQCSTYPSPPRFSCLIVFSCVILGLGRTFSAYGLGRTFSAWVWRRQMPKQRAHFPSFLHAYASWLMHACMKPHPEELERCSRSNGAGTGRTPQQRAQPHMTVFFVCSFFVCRAPTEC